MRSSSVPALEGSRHPGQRLPRPTLLWKVSPGTPPVRLGIHYEWTKRIIDLVLAIVLLVVLSPVLVLISALVWLDSGRPVLFRQVRLGRRGVPFRCLKFRTMRPDAERVLASDRELKRLYLAHNFKLPPGCDPRVTRLGRFLRTTSLDELPQLLNVIEGTMSLVGPRPIVPQELVEYGPQAGTFLSVRPGLTGAWQVGGRSRVDYPERAGIDIAYIRSWSLRGDFLILLRTLPAVIARRGAY